MGRDKGKSRDLTQDEAALEADVLAAVRRFVRKQRRRGIKVQYLNLLWDGARYPHLSTEYGRWDGKVVQLPPFQGPENDTTGEAVSGIFPVVPPAPAEKVEGKNGSILQTMTLSSMICVLKG